MTESDTPVAVVTGGSRGAGLGIARALDDAGWRVYATGRTIVDRGDGVVPVPLDHRDDAAVGALFARVADETGRLDLLVNNATALHDELTGPKPFWEKPLELVDVIEVGLRSAYVASWYAAPLMVARGRGLIVNTSSPGSVCYMHGPPCIRSDRNRGIVIDIAEVAAQATARHALVHQPREELTMTNQPIGTQSAGLLYSFAPTEGVLAVYRSTAVRDTDTIYRPVIDIVGDAAPLIRDVVEDPDMVSGSAELLVYAVAA